MGEDDIKFEFVDASDEFARSFLSGDEEEEEEGGSATAIRTTTTVLNVQGIPVLNGDHVADLNDLLREGRGHHLHPHTVYICVCLRAPQKHTITKCRWCGCVRSPPCGRFNVAIYHIYSVYTAYIGGN